MAEKRQLSPAATPVKEDPHARQVSSGATPLAQQGLLDFGPLAPLPAEQPPLIGVLQGDAALWLQQPTLAFERWASSASINSGRGFSPDTRKVYGAMWSKFCRFCVEYGKTPALADESALLLFFDHLARERQSLQSRARGMQIARSRDGGGTSRQARRYLYLISRIQANLLILGVRTQALGNAALLLLDRMEPEPTRPDPSALKPAGQVQLRSALAKMSTRSDWRTLRDRAIVELLVGSGLTSRQLRQLSVGADCLQVQESPAWVFPQRARRGQPSPGKVPISREAATIVARWLQWRVRHIPGEVLFPSTLAGEPMSSASLYRCVAHALELSRESSDMLPAHHLGPRTLRHTFATRQIKAGLPLDVLQQWMGHAKPSSTEVYKRLVPDPLGYEPV